MVAPRWSRTLAIPCVAGQRQKTDAIVEGVHFKKNDPADKVGHKALARALSDIAAMAGEPNSALITLGLPGDFDQQWVETLYEGLNATARAYDVAYSKRWGGSSCAYIAYVAIQSRTTPKIIPTI